MGGWAQAITQGLGRVGNEITGARDLQIEEQAKKLELLKAQAGLRELQQNWNLADPTTHKRMLESALGRKLTNEEAQRVFGINPPYPKETVQVLMGPDGKPHRYMIDETTKEKTDLGLAQWSWSDKLTKGDLTPDPSSITGYSRYMLDANGVPVKKVSNVLVPGLVPKIMEGWEKATDLDGNEYLVPKTTVTTPSIPGGGGASTQPSGPQPAPRQTASGISPTAAGVNTPLPPGARLIGHKQLPPAVQDKLLQREGALDNTIGILEDVKANIDLLQKLPMASLVQLAQSPDTVAKMMTRAAGYFESDKDKMRIESMAGDLRSLQEHINILRAPLGATGFRGEEGWQALQAQSVQALAAPGVNAKVLDNTIGVLKRLRAKTQEVLHESPAADNTIAAPAALDDETKRYLNSIGVKTN